MKNKLYILLILLMFFCFNCKANANSHTIRYEAKPGSQVEMKNVYKDRVTVFKISNDNYILYCANGNNTVFEGNFDLNCKPYDKNLKQLIYVYQNSYGKGKASWDSIDKVDGKISEDIQKIYSITQTAVWNYTVAPNNFSSNLIDNSSYNNLISNADEFAKTGVVLKLNISNLDMNLYGDYFVSEEITVNSKYLDEDATVKLENNTNGAFITNDVKSSSGVNELKVKDGSKFYIKVKANSETSNKAVMLSYNGKSSYGGDIYICKPDSQRDMQDVVKYENKSEIIKNNIILNTKKVPDKKYKIVISKKDITGNKDLPGAVLVLRKNNVDLFSWTTDGKDKEIEVVAGNYELIEERAPIGYAKEKNSVKFTITENGRIEIDKKEVGSIVIKNKLIEIIISKEDVVKEGELPGAELKLLDEKGNIAKDINGVELKWTSTNEPKKINIAAGKYVLEEVTAPNGYAKSNEKLDFEVNEYGKIIIDGKEVPKVVMKNGQIKIIISKIEKNKTYELEGAVMQIFDETGKNVVLEWTTRKFPKEINLVTGNYILREKSAPKGFELSDKEIKFTVTEDGKVKIKDKIIDDNKITFENVREIIVSPETGNNVLIVSIIVSIVALGGLVYYISKKKIK